MWTGKQINMHLRHNKECKDLYSEAEILNLKREMKSIRNKEYRKKPENKIAQQKANKKYKEKPENKIAEQNYNRAYNEKIEKKERKKNTIQKITRFTTESIPKRFYQRKEPKLLQSIF